jgi:molecular chaperone GrpE (heat shock protein)
MFAFLKRWFGRADDAVALNTPRETQALPLELHERDRTIATLKADLERLRRGEGDRVNELVSARQQQLLADLAGPVAQLLTQGHLLEVEGRPVQARDVLAVARRLIRCLEDEGLAAQGRVGETVAFDPDRHEPLSGEVPQGGQPVVVRIVGITHRGKVLRKAGVGPEGE